MKEAIILWFSSPANLILLLIGFIQVMKILRPYFPGTVATGYDKVANFMQWAIPATYHTVESLEARGIIDKNSKFATFLTQLFDQAAKQGINLSMNEVIKTQAIVAGLAQASKIPGTVPIPGSKDPKAVDSKSQ